ncbi:uroporphyrinogen-III synthase [Thalassomonas haliotis]|uniref:Uroporphyrinogen-III synthase n=1 Tax=Thalassomonas haliotis TaxID=485448 RepID=A0ABY7VFI5_9GAMM|nr:uroporphyrinogen-III synthase [Thalassomonas haliotis]WDE11771.1 uroporphyrinogen-III synthase [Thalassomonas haliotis]
MTTSKLKVLITRPQEKGRVLAQKLTQLGICASHQALFSYQALANQSQIKQSLALSPHPVLIFVSVPAVTYAHLSWPLQHWPHQSVIAVGTATKKALQQSGIDNVICPQEHNSEGMLALPELTEVDKKQIIIVRGNGGRELMAETLSQRGAKVNYLESYQRIWLSLPRDIPQQWQAKQINCIVITSNALLERMVEILAPLDECWQKNCLYVVASERIAAKAKTLGLQRVINARGADDQAITGTLLNLEPK